MAGYSSVGDYLIRSLYGRGIKHAFGVPGDSVLSFYDRLTKSNISVINMCDEQGAGFAADAYARIRGLGLVCVTYGVGALKVINTTAQAYAEKSPVVVISGSPGVDEQARNPLLHHKVREFGTQKKIFDEITVASTVLDHPKTAIQEINRVLTQALRFKRPVYIELPRDMVFAQIKSEDQYYDIAEEELLLSGETQGQVADPSALQEAVTEASRIISASDRPVVIAGEEIHRFGLQNKLLAFIEKAKMPVAATILSKSVISELHPLFVGIYGGAVGQEKARQIVESSDCIVILGASLSDITLGAFTGQIDQNKLIYVDTEKLSVKFHQYSNIGIGELLDGLTASMNGVGGGRPKPGDHSLVSFATDTNLPNLADATSHLINNGPESSSGGNDDYGEDNSPTDRTTMLSTTPEPRQSLPKPTTGKNITIRYLFEYINSCLTDDMIVLADVGDALFAGTDLVIHGKTRFLSPAYYASLGFSVPASIGVQLAEPSLRPLVLVGDGAFQMTGMEVSTVLRHKLNPIVIVLNNGIYLTEDLMLKGKFNYLQQWNFAKIPDVIAGGYGFVIQTEDQLVNAFSKALGTEDALCILDIRLGQNDKSPALGRLAQGLAKRFNSHLNERSG